MPNQGFPSPLKTALLTSIARPGRYLSETEAWDKIMPAALRLQQTFVSWPDLESNFLLGRQFWSMEQSRQTGATYKAIYDEFIEEKDSPWNANDWNMDLQVTTPLPIVENPHGQKMHGAASNPLGGCLGADRDRMIPCGIRQNFIKFREQIELIARIRGPTVLISSRFQLRPAELHACPKCEALRLLFIQ
jgi:hypothetical protein